MIGYRLCWAQSAGIKATVNGEMSVACPATRRDGRRRLKLRNKEAKVRYLKPQTSNFESENLQTWVFKLQTWVFKLETAKVGSLKLQSAKVKIFKLESSNLKLRKWETSSLESENLQTWVFKLQTAKVRTFKPSNLKPKLRKWKSSKLRAESFQLLSFDKLQVLKNWELELHVRN